MVAQSMTLKCDLQILTQKYDSKILLSKPDPQLLVVFNCIYFSYQFTDSSQTFFIIDPTWLSIQTFLSSSNPTELDESALRTSLKYCWISNSVSNDITIKYAPF